tara:strand:- start:125 stop:391 length:267 start_codon:yes stop_codon:yes gene_type:complete
MTRRIPILSLNDTSSKKPQVYKSLVEGISEAIKTNKKEIKLCEIKNSNTFITVEKPEWKDSLDSALQFYINTEEYEECSKIKNLIDKL